MTTLSLKQLLIKKLDNGRRHGTDREKIYASIKLIDHVLDFNADIDSKKVQIFRKLRQRMIEQLQSGNVSTRTLVFTSANVLLDEFGEQEWL